MEVVVRGGVLVDGIGRMVIDREMSLGVWLGVWENASGKGRVGSGLEYRSVYLWG